VKQTLSTSGLEIWLAETLPDDLPVTVRPRRQTAANSMFSILRQLSPLSVTPRGCRGKKVMRIGADLTFPSETFGWVSQLGGEFCHSPGTIREFLAAAAMCLSAPAEGSRPDYLLAEKAYIPPCSASRPWSAAAKWPPCSVLRRRIRRPFSHSGIAGDDSKTE